jgi:hypothetical protein
MSERLRVLVLESERGAADGAAHDLARAGHEIVRCHDAGAPAFPCSGLADDGECPLDDAVDVALTVRAHPRSQPTGYEDGVACALRAHVPLVVAGTTALNPYEPWTAAEISHDGDVVAACEEAATAPLPRHGERATAMLHEVLRRRDVPAEAAHVVVRRHDGALAVTVCGAGALDVHTRSIAAVRITGALRALDRHAKAIDVSFDDR